MAKKNFSGRAANVFFDPPTKENEVSVESYVDELPKEKANTDNDVYTHKYTHIIKKRESKTKRLQLLVKPSTHVAIQRIAEESGTSVNDIINTILEEYIK